MNELIEELSALAGIIPEYYDIWGRRHEASINTKKSILRAMGLNVDKEEDLKEELRKIKTPRIVEPAIVVSEEAQPATFALQIPVGGDGGEDGGGDGEYGARIRWTLTDEAGNTEEHLDEVLAAGIVEAEGLRSVRFNVKDKAVRPSGYYDVSFRVETSGGLTQAASRLIIAPERCFILPDIGRSWGVTLNLYALRSGENWGAGDFSDLRKVIDWVAGLGGDFVGINPLHAIPNRLPSGISPYSPISRLYRNFIYIDMKAVPYSERLGIEAYMPEIKTLREKDFVDYENVASLKVKALKECFNLFIKNKRSKDYRGFKKYMEKEGSSVDDFASWMALHETYGWSMPPDYRDPDGHAVRKFKRIKANKDKILFYKFLQWVLDSQLCFIAETARQKGMKLGIYHDLAVGSVGGGSDAWCMGRVFAHGADAGAPPDDFNPKGQNWGFPPLSPEGLRETGYDIFIKTIRKNINSGGLLRVDHALGLFRFFWVPEGMDAAEGAYVKYPASDLLRLIALESTRAKCMIVAEDLGTVGPDVRKMLRRFGMLSYRLFYFERMYPEPYFLKPEHYPDAAFVSITTHDLPTIYGWWKAADIEVRGRLSMYKDEDSLRRDIENRKKDKELVLSTLKEHGLLREDFRTDEMNTELCLAVYRYLARTPSMFVGVSLDDMLGVVEQQNLPGTVDEYPNWRRKTPLCLEEIVLKGRDFAEMFKNEGR